MSIFDIPQCRELLVLSAMSLIFAFQSGVSLYITFVPLSLQCRPAYSVFVMGRN